MEVERIKSKDINNLKEHLQSLTHPVVITDFFENWPSLKLAKESSNKLLRNLIQFTNQETVDTLLIDKKFKGLIGYSDDSFERYTFSKQNAPLIAVLKKLIVSQPNNSDFDIAVQSAPIQKCMPGFLDQNPSPGFLSNISPRIWLGNSATVPGHYDTDYNIALNLCGRRTFYLLPAEQISNLYVAPIDKSITGPAISPVDFESPDLEKFPKFKHCSGMLKVATLDIGEAVFIPPLWWHNVKATDPVNILINYWWKKANSEQHSVIEPSDCLLQCILSIRNLPESQRKAWQSIFEHYVFKRTDGYLEENNDYQGILSASSTDIQTIQESLKQRILK